MRIPTIRLSVFLVLTAACVGQQTQQPGVSVGGAALHLNMERQEALKKLSLCCQTVPFGNAAVIVSDKRNVNRSFGVVYFDQGKVSGIAADRDTSFKPPSYQTALAFYRLVDGFAHGEPAQVTVYAYSLEGSNGTGKYVVMRFADGRRIQFQLVNPDPSEHVSQQVSVSECVGNCVDWH